MALVVDVGKESESVIKGEFVGEVVKVGIMVDVVEVETVAKKGGDGEV